jgi:hypothetical protein
MKSGPGDVVTLHAPGGSQQLHIVDVRYERVSVASFTEPPGAGHDFLNFSRAVALLQQGALHSSCRDHVSAATIVLQEKTTFRKEEL